MPAGRHCRPGLNGPPRPTPCSTAPIATCIARRRKKPGKIRAFSSDASVARMERQRNPGLTSSRISLRYIRATTPNGAQKNRTARSRLSSLLGARSIVAAIEAVMMVVVMMVMVAVARHDNDARPISVIVSTVIAVVMMVGVVVMMVVVVVAGRHNDDRPISSIVSSVVAVVMMVVVVVVMMMMIVVLGKL